MLPIVACTTFGFQASTVSSLQMMWSMPNQSAMRMMVPRLPGSWMPSRERRRGFFEEGGRRKEEGDMSEG